MYVGKLIFSQLMDHLPMHTFRRCVTRYQGERYVKRFHCLDQYLVMAFAQLTHQESLRIKSFFGTSENAVKTQIWTAISVYILMAIIKKRLDLKTDLYTILQILSLTLFEKTPLDQMLTNHDYKIDGYDMCSQFNLFDNLTGQ